MAIRPGTDPKSELEQYGVWVKAEPQDIVDEAPGFGDTSSELSVDSASVPEESFLSEDEEKLLGSFDSEFDSEASGPLPDIEDMPALEESLLPSDSEPASEENEDSVPNAIDITLEESDNVGSSSAFHPGVEIDMSSVEGLDTPDNPQHLPSSSIEDVSSEFFDSSEKPGSSGASTSSVDASQFVSGMDDVTAEFLDIEDSIEAPKSAVENSAEFEPLDIDLRFDDSVGASAPSASKQSDVQEAGFEAVTEFDDFLSTDSSSESSGVEPGFDDVSAVERELSSPPAAPSSFPRQGPSAGAAPKPDLSTEILLKIADELSSIRGELVSLKSKIGDVLSAGEAVITKPSEAPAEEEDSVSAGGFFDDEEDETIALTGDELDNILNTADFTTEEATDTEQPLGIDDLAGNLASSDDGDLLDESLLPESGDYSPPSMIEPAIEEVRLGEADSVDEIVEEHDDLSFVAEDGVVPLTKAPDDTSYLESPDSLDIGSDSLPADKPLVEPDLSDFDLGIEDLEPRPEVEEELPLAGGENLSSEAEDITLGMEAGLGYEAGLSAEEVPEEAEFIETIPEIDETNFSEINLHEENTAASEASEVEEIDSQEDVESSPISDISEEEEDLMLSAIEEPMAPSHDVALPSSPRADDDGDRLKSEIKSVLTYLDKLLDSLPEEKIEEFARSKYFDTYKKLFEELGLV